MFAVVSISGAIKKKLVFLIGYEFYSEYNEIYHLQVESSVEIPGKAITALLRVLNNWDSLPNIHSLKMTDDPALCAL